MMYDRKDQVEAHSFMSGRIVSAVLRFDPDSPERPLRRTVNGLLSGIGIGVIVMVVIVIVAYFTGRSGGDAWRAPGSLIVEKGTGNRFLLVEGRLRPALNYASARLLVRGAPKVVEVDSRALSSVPRGGPVGILGAPDAVPSKSSATPWTVCAGIADGKPAVSVRIGDVPETRFANADEAVLVAVEGQEYVVWSGSKSRVTGSWAPRALGLQDRTAPSVAPAWLNSFPSGPDLGSLPLRRGVPGPVVAGQPTTAGQLVDVPDAVGQRQFVADPAGLVPISETVAVLITADPGVAHPPTLTITPAQLAGQRVLSAPSWQDQFPQSPPAAFAAGQGEATCMRWDRDEAALVRAPSAKGPGQSGNQAAFARDGRVAALVDVAIGAGFLARTRPAPGVAGDGLHLVTEAGAKFPVATADAAAALGLPVEQAQLVPAELLALLPTGPVLDVMK